LKYSVENFFVLRSPLFPFSKVFVESINEILQNVKLREAIFISSPNLTSELEKLEVVSITEKDREKIIQSAMRYWLRACYRPTPFGIFAGISLGNVSNETLIETVGQHQYRKNTRLDTHFLSTVVQGILSHDDIIKSVKWFANNTVYEVFDSVRFIKYHIDKNNRTHQLANASRSEYLSLVMRRASNGSTIGELADSLVSDEITAEEASEFIKEMISERLLLSDLEPQVTGQEYHVQLLGKLKSLPEANSYRKKLFDITGKLKLADNYQIGHASSYYNEVVNELINWGGEYDSGKLLQCDLYKPVIHCNLSQSIISELEKAVEFLSKINPRPEESKMDTFKIEFLKRYDSMEVSLVEVLDAETGIGYPANQQSNSDYAPLLVGIHLETINVPSPAWNGKWSEYLISRLEVAIKTGSFEIELTDSDISGIFPQAEEQINFLPKSAYTLCSVFSDNESDNFTIYHNVTSGPSSANLLSRFCYTDLDLKSFAKDLLDNETQLFPNCLLAEILHIPQARLGNILMRPTLRDYEIPILTRASVDVGHTIPLSDLTVSVRNNRVVLFSKKLKKEIIPRLTSAHNFTLNPIPHYHFLCDLQFQGINGVLSWDWGILNHFSFLPRVRYRRTVLSKARWALRIDEITTKKEITITELAALLPEHFKKRSIPNVITIFEGDNQLPIDITQSYCQKILAQDILNQKTLLIHECLFNDKNLVVKGPEGMFTNEVIIPWKEYRSTTEDIIKESQESNESPVERIFAPGNQWLYVKIYCGVKSADRILVESLRPITQRLLHEKTILKFFFIRYSDPENHIRIRFLINGDNLLALMNLLNQELKPYIDSNLIWKIQNDTYVRELERYGKENIENAESVFYYDSMACLEILSQLSGDSGDELRWKLAIKGVDDLMEAFNLDVVAKRDFLFNLSRSFLREFDADNSVFKKQLSEKYRKEKSEIELALASFNGEQEFSSVLESFKTRQENIKMLVKNSSKVAEKDDLKVSKINLLSSYIHMFLNRFLRSKHRLQEMIVYDLLYQHFKSYVARRQDTKH